MNLIINGDKTIANSTQADIQREIGRLAIGDFAILEQSGQHYMQIALNADRFILEVRTGSADQHYQTDLATHQEIETAFTQYLEDAGQIKSLYPWQRINLT